MWVSPGGGWGRAATAAVKVEWNTDLEKPGLNCISQNLLVRRGPSRGSQPFPARSQEPGREPLTRLWLSWARLPFTTQ